MLHFGEMGGCRCDRNRDIKQIIVARHLHDNCTSAHIFQTTYITDLTVSVFVPFEPAGCVSLGDNFLNF
jgi:hypothetical protein